MHIGKRNLEFQYQLNDKERDLGVSMVKDLKFSKQCLLALIKANLMLGIIYWGISYKSAEVISKLYKFRVLYLVLDTNKFERCIYARGVQRRATKMIPNLRNLSYEERLIRLIMFCLRPRRLRGDMIQDYS